MAKAKKQEKGKGNGGGKGGNGGAGPGKAKDMIERSEAGRERKRAERRQNELAKEIAMKAGRSSDIFALVSQEPGRYKFPETGPAIYLRAEEVETVASKTELIGIFIEGIDEGHELFGKKFNPKTYLPVHKICSENFVSKLEHVSKEQQEMLKSYLSRIYSEALSAKRELDAKRESDMEKERSEREEAAFQELLQKSARTNMKKLQNGNGGFYRLRNGVIILFEQKKDTRGVIRVVQSDLPEFPVEDYFLHASTTRVSDFVKKSNMSEKMHAWLSELHKMIREHCPQGISDIKAKELPSTVVKTEVKQEVKMAEPMKPEEKPTETVPAVAASQTSPNGPIDIEDAVEISVATFHGKEGKYFFEADGGKAFFEVVKHGGMITIEFIGVDAMFPEDHMLSEIWRNHGALQFPLKSLENGIEETVLYDLDKKEARKALRSFLRKIGEGFGLRPKRKVIPDTVAHAVDLREKLAPYFMEEQQAA